jgi:hypothetical protein
MVSSPSKFQIEAIDDEESLIVPTPTNIKTRKEPY